MSEALQQWEREFRREAKADKLRALRDHLRALNLEVRPQPILEGTIHVVRACAAYAQIDGQSYARFLAMQTYDPARSPRAVYAFTFSLCGKAFARVLLGRELRGLDLADLFDHPWQEYEVCGFDCFWVARVDRTALKERESVIIERQVTDDLLFDYLEEELDICIEDCLDEDYQPVGVLLVTVHDLRFMKSHKARERT
jgi:hypothetical protein